MHEKQAGALVAQLQELTIVKRSVRGARCTVGMLLERMAAAAVDEAAALAAALDDPSIPAADIGRVLNSHGHDMQSGTLARHRRRGQPTGCRCPR